MPRYNRMTPAVCARLQRVAETLHTDNENATIKTAADFLGVFYRGMLTAARAPRDQYYMHLVDARTGRPPQYSLAQLLAFGFDESSKLWRPGPEFDAHMTARLLSAIAAAPAPTVLQTHGLQYPAPPPAAVQPPVAPAAVQPVVAPVTVANRDLVALLEPIVYLVQGYTYPQGDPSTAAAADPLIMDLYDYIDANRGEPRALAEWIAQHIPPAARPEFVRCWKLAVRRCQGRFGGAVRAI